MVVSNIVQNVKFKEDKSVDKHDKKTEVSIFRINLFDRDVLVSLGKVNTSLYNDIYFAPVYLILNENVQIKIGIYEFLAEDYTSLLDEDNDLDIAYLDGPLLFESVTKEYIHDTMDKYELLNDVSSSESEDDTDEEEEEQRVTKENTDEMIPFMYEDDDEAYLELEETKEDNNEHVKIFKNSTNTSWIEEFYKNNQYSLLDNEGGGDCLFATIRDGLKHNNISITVPEIRKLLSESTTLEQFKTYKENYDLLRKEIDETDDKMLEIKKRHIDLANEYKKITTKAKQEKDRDNKLILKDKAVQIKTDFESIKPIFKKYKEDKKVAEENILEFNFMEDIDTLDDLKKMINTCKFWADAASITRIEFIMNIKLIVLSSEYYKMGLKERVVTCGDFTLKEIEEKGYFNPKHYIIIDHTGDHYKLIKYKGKGAMLFHQLPYKLREDLIEQCAMSKGKTIYNYIPKFQTYMGVPVTMKQQGDVGMEEIDSDNEAEMTPSTGVEDEGELFDDSVIFQFYSKSKDVAPGKGSGENISPKMMTEFDELKNVKNWRHQLSNFYHKKNKNNKVVALFKLDGYSWASVEHYYHANKFKKNNLDFYKLFTMESKSDISTDPIAAKGAGGKTGKVNKKKFRPSDIKMDEGFMMNRKNEDVMYNGQLAKYNQNTGLKKMLLLTKDAKLVHFSRGGSIIFYDTMKIRKRLQKQGQE
tara:strand:+ start:2259 stop:4358 length:2100 start_codon:yes stop_codon:yes gene_type:complete